ncbi:MAG: hypothetical protein JXA07_14460 [Spirochaetes bacterium]|nr:hypothetical protein [Spirochaetota bacterium]
MKAIFRIQLAVCMILAFSGVLYAAESGTTEKKPDDTDYCVACHEGLPQPLLQRPAVAWKSSIHAGEGKKCSLCHGGDPGVNDRIKAKSRLANYIGRPDKKTIPGFCGREGCHAAALDQFRRGPHHTSVQKDGEPGCVFCHGAHNVSRSSLKIITAKSCSSCHPADYSREIVSMIGGMDRSIAGIDAGLNALTDKHADVTVMKERLDNIRHLFNQMVHAFSKNEMASSRKIIEMEITSLESESKSKVASMRRLDILYIAMVTFGLAIIVGMSFYILVMYSRRKK